MSRAIDLELDLADATAPKSRGPIGKLFRLLTLPFRLVGGVLKALFNVVRVALFILTFPIVLAVVLVRKLVGAIADVLYALFRVVAVVVGTVVGVVTFVLRTLLGTVLLVFKLLLGIVTLPLKLLGTVFRLGRRSTKVS